MFIKCHECGYVGNSHKGANDEQRLPLCPLCKGFYVDTNEVIINQTKTKFCQPIKLIIPVIK